MDVGADAAGQVISLAGQVFKIGMEGMVVVVKIAGKGAVHAAALLAAALSGKKKTRGKVMLKNMLRDSKGITLFTIREQDLKKFAKEAKAYNVRYCIVKDKKQDRDGNTDMFIRAEDAAVVNRIIERFGLTAVKQDVSIEGTPEAENSYGEPVKDEDYVYGDVTISREINSLVEEETETQIKTRVPGTYGKNVRYVYFDKDGLEEVHGGRSYKVHIDPEGSYELYGADGTAAENVKGEELLRHYDRHDHDSETPGNSRARTASGAPSGRSYSEQGVTEKDAPAAGSSEGTKTADREEKPAPAYVYGDVTISRGKNSLVDEAGETGTQIRTRVPGTYGKDVRYVYFDKAGLEEVHGGRSYKVHIEPERIYQLYDRSGAAAGSVYGEELLTHYDRKDRDGAVMEDPEAVKTSRAEKSAAEPSNEKSYEDAVHEGTYNSRIPDTKNRFNRFSQRTYDFAAMDKDLLSNNDEPEPEEPGADTGQSDAGPVHENKESPGTTVKTNMGEMPVEDYREIMAGQYGFDSYEEFYAKGWRLGDGYDKEPEPRSEAELRPSVREKLSGYKKEDEDAALKRQIEAAEAKRAAETRELEKTGGDVLPGQREKINSYKESRDAAMADFLSDAKLSDAKLPDRG